MQWTGQQRYEFAKKGGDCVVELLDNSAAFLKDAASVCDRLHLQLNESDGAKVIEAIKQANGGGSSLDTAVEARIKSGEMPFDVAQFVFRGYGLRSADVLMKRIAIVEAAIQRTQDSEA